jgi:NAD(P)-dependent dehydrogenase (short-subunit alcohol dehydrogenase family)
MEIRFDGKRALVTGAGKGIGKLLSIKLAEAGANVIAISRTKSDLDALKAMNPEKIQTLCLDIGKWNETREALKGIGPVDLLVNNAGILDVKEFGEMTEEEVDRTFNINVKAVINITQLIASEMKSRGKGGSIVNISSILAEFVLPAHGIYCASKGAVHQLTRTMAVEYGPHKIRVNDVDPTVVRTPMAEKLGIYDAGNQFSENLINKTPLRRFAEPEDIVGPVFFLLSDYASMITGAALPVDGGVSVCCN